MKKAGLFIIFLFFVYCSQNGRVIERILVSKDTLGLNDSVSLVCVIKPGFIVDKIQWQANKGMFNIDTGENVIWYAKDLTNIKVTIKAFVIEKDRIVDEDSLYIVVNNSSLIMDYIVVGDSAFFKKEPFAYDTSLYVQYLYKREELSKTGTLTGISVMPSKSGSKHYTAFTVYISEQHRDSLSNMFYENVDEHLTEVYYSEDYYLEDTFVNNWKDIYFTKDFYYTGKDLIVIFKRLLSSQGETPGEIYYFSSSYPCMLRTKDPFEKGSIREEKPYIRFIFKRD